MKLTCLRISVCSYFQNSAALVNVALRKGHTEAWNQPWVLTGPCLIWAAVLIQQRSVRQGFSLKSASKVMNVLSL